MAIPKNSDLLYKPNAALVMVPRLGKLHLTTRKMYNVLLRTTQRQVLALRKEGGVIDAEYLFADRLTDVVNSFASGDSDPKTSVKKYLSEMRRVEVDWEAPDAKEGVVWRSMGLLSEAQLEIRSGTYWVKWALPPSLLKAIADPEFFTPIDLDKIAQLTSYTAVALYEICVRYRNNPNGKTSRNPPDWWVDALTNTPAPIDPVTGKKRRREWRKLKNASVLEAIQEINEKTDIFIGLLEHKSGRTVAEVQFTVRMKTSERTQDVRPNVNADLVIKADKRGITIDNLINLKTAGHTDEEINFGLVKLGERLELAESDPVENKAAYLKSIIRHISGRVVLTHSESAKTVVVPIVEEIKPWAAQRRSDFKALFEALPKEGRKLYIEDAMNDLIKRGVASTTMIRKVVEGDWKNPTLVSRAVELYAVAVDGTDWMVER